MQLNKIKKLFIVISGFLVLVSAYHFFYAKKIIPGVVIGNTKVGGMNYQDAKKALEASLNSTDKKLKISYENKEYTIGPDDLGLEYDLDASLSRAYEVGRTGNILIDTKDKIAGVFKNLLIKAFYVFSEEALNNQLNKIIGEINQDALDASYIINDNEKVDISESRIGKKVDGDALYKAVVYSFDQMEFSAKLIPVKEVNPKIYEETLITLKPKVEDSIKQSITVKLNTKVWELSQAQLIDFITVNIDNSGKIDGLTLNKPKFETYIELLSQEVNTLPKGKVTSTEETRVTGFEIISQGQELDTKKFTDDFKSALFDKEVTHEINLKVIPTTGPTTKERYGIYALLGTGKSKFSGSIPGRIHNLTLAAQRTDGVLVAPGGIYSFNNSVGDISGATGYNTAYIISNGRTVLGEGGGVCQTSTTMFRAALNAGLPIVKRYPHAYRVSYYEIESPVGIDASIFQPTLDFQFKNDTPNYILIQASWDLNEQSLEFKIYGTPDGREVTITEPVVTSYTPAPEPLYQDDPNLPEGTIRQVDFAAPGANVYFTREVKRGGEVIISDTFTSRYQAWRAVYLKGTKD